MNVGLLIYFDEIKMFYETVWLYFCFSFDTRGQVYSLGKPEVGLWVIFFSSGVETLNPIHTCVAHCYLNFSYSASDNI